MTDAGDQTPTTPADAGDQTPTPAADAGNTAAPAVGTIGEAAGDLAAGALVTDHEYAAIVAAFSDDQAAMAAYQALADAESAGTVHVDGVLVFKTDANLDVKIQKMTDHSTKTGVKWGVVGGVVLGVLFPPSIIASAVGWGVAGGVLGKLRAELHKAEVGDALIGALGPNESGLLALVAAGDVDAVTTAMPTAIRVRSAGVDDKTANDLKAAAAEAS